VRTVFLRAGASDVAAERKSTFAAEMHDWATMLRVAGAAEEEQGGAAVEHVVLVDEPCRGTATRDGARLLGALLDAMPTSTACAVTTHFRSDEVRPRRRACRWVTFSADVDGASGDCTPSYALRDGECTESLALRVARAAGIPEAVLRAAAEEEVGREAGEAPTTRAAEASVAEAEEREVRAAMRGAGVMAAEEEEEGRVVVMPGTGYAPPPGVRCAVYVLFTDLGVYVGETTDVTTRMEAHRETKRVRKILLVPCAHKGEGRELEAVLIHEVRHRSVRLLSVHAGW